MTQRKWELITSGFISLFKTTKKSVNLPKSSDILRTYLKQRNLTSWTAFYVPRCEVQNDLWGQSHFNFEVEQANYHVLRTGAFPFVKFHCTLRPKGQDLTLENHFYNGLKVINFGFPTLLYGLAGLIWANHTEQVTVKGYPPVTIHFWYKETHDSKN